MPVKKILVAEDSPTERQHLKEVLSKLGYVVITAENGEEALQKVRRREQKLLTKASQFICQFSGH